MWLRAERVKRGRPGSRWLGSTAKPGPSDRVDSGTSSQHRSHRRRLVVDASEVEESGAEWRRRRCEGEAGGLATEAEASLPPNPRFALRPEAKMATISMEGAKRTVGVGVRHGGRCRD